MPYYKECAGCVCCLGVLLMIILVPISLRRLEYYEYGLVKSPGGSVSTDEVYASGRHLVGPAHSFVVYPADAQLVSFEELEVFSSGSNNSVGLSFKVDVDFTFLLIEEEIGELHIELASAYRQVISSRARDAIKNEAIYVTFTEYFQNRTQVEQRFRQAIEVRWEEQPSVHAVLDQFHLGRIRITESVAERQLEAAIQNERNEKESNQQKAALEREQTSVQVNEIQLQTDKILRTATAEANLLRSNANAESRQIRAAAEIDGLAALFSQAEIATQEERTAYTYVRNLQRRDSVHVDVSYLSSDNIVRTTAAAS